MKRKTDSTQIATLFLSILALLILLWLTGCMTHEEALKASQRKNQQSVIFHAEDWRYVRKDWSPVVGDSVYVLVNVNGDTARAPFEYWIEF